MSILWEITIYSFCSANCWLRVLGSVVIQLYAGECTPSVDRALHNVQFVHWVFDEHNFNVC